MIDSHEFQAPTPAELFETSIATIEIGVHAAISAAMPEGDYDKFCASREFNFLAMLSGAEAVPEATEDLPEDYGQLSQLESEAVNLEQAFESLQTSVLDGKCSATTPNGDPYLTTVQLPYDVQMAEVAKAIDSDPELSPAERTAMQSAYFTTTSRTKYLVHDGEIVAEHESYERSGDYANYWTKREVLAQSLADERAEGLNGMPIAAEEADKLLTDLNDLQRLVEGLKGFDSQSIFSVVEQITGQPRPE